MNYKRSDFTGFTWHLFGAYLEVVFCKGKLVTIAFNPKRLSKTIYLLDRGI
jgi:hypothetical protein